MALLIACSTGGTTDKADDADTDGATTRDTDRGQDSDDVWDTGLLSPGGVDGDTDTPTYGDPDIGPTVLDGTWVGTFELRNVVPLFATNPLCVGDVTFSFDGTAYRHGRASFSCTHWDPNFDGLGGLTRYGDLDGIGLATLDPGDLSQVSFDFFLRAPNMLDFDKRGVVATIDGDTLTVDYDAVTGAGTLREGFRLDITATRTEE